jgi:hypothetical protein
MSPSICPVSQYDAIPILAVSQFIATTGEVETFPPGVIVREFSPAATGINGWLGNYNDGGGGGGNWVAWSLPLDVRVCTRFTLLYALKMREASHDQVMGIDVKIANTVAADVAPYVAPRLSLLSPAAWETVGTMTIGRAYPFGTFPPPWPNPVTGPNFPIVYKSASLSWEIGQKFNAGSGPQLGSDGRIVLWLRGPLTGGTTWNSFVYVSLIAST